MSVGLTSIVTSVIEILLDWADTGEIKKPGEQAPTNLFVDCSNGVDKKLQALAEQSVDDVMRQIERFPVILMSLRLLDYSARYDPRIKKLDIPTRPYATEWMNLLGSLLHERRDEARDIFNLLERYAGELAERLEDDHKDESDLLNNVSHQPNPVMRLAEVLTNLLGRGATQTQVIKLVDSVLLTNRPNGLARKRSEHRKIDSNSGVKRRDVRSIVFTDSVLDYLVHLHILKPGNRKGYQRLSFKRFIDVLYERYGFCIDQAPPGMTISNDLLQQNRLALERRLRDLGLLIGVNDAEAMKRLTPRFQIQEENGNGVD